MASCASFVKFFCFYVLCSVLVIDVYFFVIKPQLLKSVYKSENLYNGPAITDSSSHPESSSELLKIRNCYRNTDSIKEDTDSCIYLPGKEIKNKNQSYTRYMQKIILNILHSLWDGIFLALEEIEQVSVSLVQTLTVLFAESNTHPTTTVEHPSKIQELHINELTKPIDSGVILDAVDILQGTFALSARIQRSILAKNVKIHRPSNEENFINVTYLNVTKKLELSIDVIREANNTLRLAKEFIRQGNLAKAKKLLDHARQLDPYNADAMAAYGEVFEQHMPPDYVRAEHYYGKALLADPTNEKAKASRLRTLPLVEQIDQARFNRIDQKVYQYYHIPETHPGLRRLKKEHYFRYVYHSNAIEGNTLSLAQTRAILETRIAVGGKSLLEQNEVLGLDAALKFLNSSLLRKPGPMQLTDLLEIHRRVLGYVDLQEAGRLRNTQVYIADFEPPPAGLVPSLMSDFLSWLNSEDTLDLHPVERAALAHWKLVYIHPFYDGNGRTARLLMNLILMQAGYPPAIVRVEDRALYYQLIKEANEGDVRPFIRFIGHCTEATIDEFLHTAKQVTNFEADMLSSSLAKQPMSDSDCKSRVINL